MFVDRGCLFRITLYYTDSRLLPLKQFSLYPLEFSQFALLTPSRLVLLLSRTVLILFVLLATTTLLCDPVGLNYWNSLLVLHVVVFLSLNDHLIIIASIIA